VFIWLAVAAFLPLLAGPGFAGAPAYWPAVQSSGGVSAAVAPGVLYSHYSVRTSNGPLSIHHLRVDLANPSVRLGTALANNQLISGDETVSSMMAHWSGAVAGINGDFFDIGDSGMPLNIMVRDGVLLRSPTGWAALAIGRDGGVRIERFRWTGSIAVPAARQSYWLSGFNTGIAPNGLTVLSNVRGYGAPEPGRWMRQTVVELAPAGERPGAPAAAAGGHYTVKRVWPQQAYYAPFPEREILLVGEGDAAAWLLHNVEAGMAIDVNLNTQPDWRGLATVVGGGPLLVQNGRRIADPHNPVPDERYVRNPVSAVGITQDGRTMFLVAVDGRQSRLSIGLTQPQLAAYMQWLGAYQAMEFDSGGSVTMAVRFPGRPWPAVVNSPSDGHERAVANALLVFSVPVARQAHGAGLIRGAAAPR